MCLCASKSSDERLKRAFERTKPGKAFARTMPGKAPEISRIKKQKLSPPNYKVIDNFNKAFF